MRPMLIPAWLVIMVLSSGCDEVCMRRGSVEPASEEGHGPIVVNGGASARLDGGPGPQSDHGRVPAADTTPAPRLDSGAAGGACGNDFESQVFALVNQARADAGLAAYACDPAAAKVARDYSQLMCDLGQMGHTVGGTTAFQRMASGGVKFMTAGENVAAGQSTPAMVMKSWMGSSGHRANILGNFSFIGVGYAKCNGAHFWTQNFWK